MQKTIIINESVFRKVIETEILNESNLDKSDVEKIVKDTFKSDRQIDKDLEKRIKKIVASIPSCRRARGFRNDKNTSSEFKCNKDSYIEITIKQKGKIN